MNPRTCASRTSQLRTLKTKAHAKSTRATGAKHHTAAIAIQVNGYAEAVACYKGRECITIGLRPIVPCAEMSSTGVAMNKPQPQRLQSHPNPL